MYLKKLEISGFKSFANKTSLSFNQGTTAVVGPNGSGKSNVADAIRWVMGEQSIKSLRGKKSEDVIFSGSDRRGRLGLAEVKLELDNSDGQVPIEFSELVITRRIYRDGGSDYLINGSKSKLAEINLLLTRANFGHKTYSVIGQGMIDNFLISTPQERKEFFEEATGVKEFQIKKNQSLNKLEHTWDNLVKIEIKLKEIEPQLKMLTRQINKLNQRKEIEEKLSQIKTEYYSRILNEHQEKYNQKQEDIKNESKKTQKLEDDLIVIKKNISNAFGREKNNQLEILQTKEREFFNQKIKLQEKIMQTQLEIARISNASNQTPKTRIELEEISSQVENIKKTNQTLLNKITEFNHGEIKKHLEELNYKIESLDKYINQKNIQVEDNKKIPEENQEKINQKNKELQKTNEEKEELKKLIDSLQIQIKEEKSKDDEIRNSFSEIQNSYDNKQRELNQLNQKITNLRIELAKNETYIFNIHEEIKDENITIDENIQKHLSIEEKNLLHSQIIKLKNQLETIGGIDPEIEDEYNKTKERYDFLSKQTEDLHKTINSLKDVITELDNNIKSQIKKSFDDINHYFKKYFKKLFNGGYAELQLLKQKDIENDTEGKIEEKIEKNSFEEFQKKHTGTGYAGIEIEATPPGKKLKSINILSGGERALTSIALISAIISSNPSPFVVLDEVDAALDEANSIRFAEIIKEISDKTQFIVITHNRATMNIASILYGVTMGNDGVSKILSVKLDKINEFINSDQE